MAMRAGRLTAADVARFTLDAVLQRRFYVLPHRKAAVGVENRLRDFLAGGAPNNPMQGVHSASSLSEPRQSSGTAVSVAGG